MLCFLFLFVNPFYADLYNMSKRLDLEVTGIKQNFMLSTAKHEHFPAHKC